MNIKEQENIILPESNKVSITQDEKDEFIQELVNQDFDDFVIDYIDACMKVTDED